MVHLFVGAAHRWIGFTLTLFILFLTAAGETGLSRGIVDLGRRHGGQVLQAPATTAVLIHAGLARLDPKPGSDNVVVGSGRGKR